MSEYLIDDVEYEVEYYTQAGSRGARDEYGQPLEPDEEAYAEVTKAWTA